MAKFRVFVDGAAGTTGLRIHERLGAREEIELLRLPEAQRKDLSARVEAVNSADIAFLCLPDTAAREVAERAAPGARILDTSTAHRTNPGWVYGFPELGARRGLIREANRVAVPGCHATGFLALAVPLVEKGLLPADHPFLCNSLTGYSGGGKQMIAAYEASDRPASYSAPRLYALGLEHKHRPEMQAVAGLSVSPLFCPVVDDYYSGLLVSLPIPVEQMSGRRQGEELADFYRDYYRGEPFITVHGVGETPPDGTLSAGEMAGRDDLEIFVLGNGEQLLLVARLDNLGKGASGAAVQCMNIMLGLSEEKGLVL